MLRAIVLIILLATISYSGEWCWSNPKPVGGQLSDVHMFPNQENMYIVGNLENLMRLDETAHPIWETILPPESPYWYRAVSFVDDSNGYMGGEPFKVFRTYDGGDNWTAIYSTPQLNKAVWDIDFVDVNNGYVVGGGKANFTGQSGLISVTHDGGDSWCEIATQYTIRAVEALDANNAIAVGDCGTVLRTSDGGLSWASVSIPAGSDINLLEIYFVNQRLAFIAGGEDELGVRGWNREIYRSIDGGLTWSCTSYPPGPKINSICFSDDNTGIAVGSLCILRTIDGGESWFSVQPGADACLTNVEYDDGRWIVVGNAGQVLKSTDNGVTWTPLHNSATAVKLFDVCFPTEQCGFVAGQLGRILRTSDGGSSWVCEETPIDQVLFGISFLDQTIGIAASGLYDGGNSILYTSDAGDNWQIAYRSTDFLYDVDYLEETSIAFAVGACGQILRSDNGGIEWKPIEYSIPLDIHMRKLCFVDQSTGYASGGQGTIGNYSSRLMKTVDGGDNWTIAQPDMEGVLHVLDFCSPSIGIIGDEAEDIYLTTDGGYTWSLILDLEEKYNLKYGVIVDPMTIIVMYRNSGDFYIPPDNVPFFCCSFDGGGTWETCTCPLNWPIGFDYNASIDRMTVVGYSGEIRQKNDFLQDLSLYGLLDSFPSVPDDLDGGACGLTDDECRDVAIDIANPISRGITASIINNTSNLQRISCSLYSIDGRLIEEGSIEVAGSSSQTVNLFRESSSIPGGYYILHLKYNGIEEVRKLVLLP